MVRLAGSGERGILSRKALLKSLRAFSPVKAPPRGSEASQLRKSSRPKPSDEDAASECLGELYATLCRLAYCPPNPGAGGEAGHFKANVSLNFAPRLSGSRDDVTLE